MDDIKLAIQFDIEQPNKEEREAPLFYRRRRKKNMEQCQLIKLAMLGNREAAKRLTDAGVLLMQGDCLELMKDIPDGSVDMVLTDPPYGIDYQSQRKKDKSEWMPKIKNDKRPFIDFIPLIKRILKPTGCVMVFTRWDVQQKFIDEMNDSGLKVKNVLIWDKEIHGMGDLKRAFASRYESIIFHSERGFEFNGKRPQDIIKCRRALPNELKHPNEKPVRLMEELICKCTHKGAVVLDLFMGSGTTGVACVNTGRDFIGMELDPGYFEVAKQRIEEAQAQARLAWNTRAPILSESELKKLEGTT